MIIFGSRTKAALVAALILTCGRCGTPAAQRLFRVRTWFTLFFVPVFPFGHGRYTMQCVYCGSESRVDRAGAERFVADAAAFAQQRQAQETLPTDGGVPAPPA